MPGQRRARSRRSDVLIYNAPLTDDEVDWVEEILVTSPLRLVADLCAVQTDSGHLAGVIGDLLTRRLASRRALAATVAPYAAAYGAPGRRGHEFLHMLLEGSGARR